MKRVGIFASVSVLSLAFATCALATSHDQDDKHRDKQNHGQEKKQQDYGHEHYQQDYKNHGQEKKEENQYKHANHSDNGNHYGQIKQMERSQQQIHEQQYEQQRYWHERQAKHWDYEHRGWQQRGGYHGYRVPDDYFRVHYGHDHWFRVYSLPFAYAGGSPRFQYGGYWFTMMDPYPEYWGATWYQNDDVYVDYHNDGYYLYNRRYPGRPGIAINISF